MSDLYIIFEKFYRALEMKCGKIGDIRIIVPKEKFAHMLGDLELNHNERPFLVEDRKNNIQTFKFHIGSGSIEVCWT